MIANDSIKQAIEKAKKELEEWLKGGRELCDKLFSEQYAACVAKNDRTNAIRCIENKAKNTGYYAADNAQRTEQPKQLSPEEDLMYKRFSREANLLKLRRPNEKAG
jgi:hypothetical protein